jgi:small ligand-binding sensory domain FIST
MSSARVRIGAGLSTEPDSRSAAAAAAGSVAQALAGLPAELAVVFASGMHLEAPEALLEGVHEVLGPSALIGCGAGGVLGEGAEHEQGTAVAVWALAGAGADASVVPFRATAESDGYRSELSGLPVSDDAGATILLADPYSFPPEAALADLAELAPGVPVLGGVASARTAAGGGLLFYGEEVCEEGAVGVSLRGIDLLACVSQGAAPLGPEVTITAGHDNVIGELAGRPALETLERIIAELSPPERTLVADGLLIGIVVETGKPEYEQGDFLVRGVLGADRESGAVAVGAAVHEGQVIRLHARDARSAGEDLRRALRGRVETMAGRAAAGALVFSCNGRGRAMFDVNDHDAAMIARELGGAPAAGFFAAGEIGPVGGRSFLHSFTATVAVFPE